MSSRFEKYTVEIRQLAAGLVAFAVLAGLVVAYSTALQEGVTQHPALAIILSSIVVCGMLVAAYRDASRYLFVIAVPLVATCAVVWILLTAKTLHHIDFYTSTIAQSVKHVPAEVPNETSALSPEHRAEFRRAHRQLTRSSLRLRHHLDRHAFWSKALFVIAIGTVAIGFLPKIVKRQPPRTP